MSLIPCPECGREISTNAEACPHCGNPMRSSTSAPSGPTCYACSAIATTKCESCRTPSCPQHLQSVYVAYGDELRCDNCCSWGMTWQVVSLVLFGVVVIIGFVAICGLH